jgi:hypothetical protein
VKGAKLEFLFQDMTKLHVAMTGDVGDKGIAVETQRGTNGLALAGHVVLLFLPMELE